MLFNADSQVTVGISKRNETVAKSPFWSSEPLPSRRERSDRCGEVVEAHLAGRRYDAAGPELQVDPANDLACEPGLLNS